LPLEAEMLIETSGREFCTTADIVDRSALKTFYSKQRKAGRFEARSLFHTSLLARIGWKILTG